MDGIDPTLLNSIAGLGSGGLVAAIVQGMKKAGIHLNNGAMFALLMALGVGTTLVFVLAASVTLTPNVTAASIITGVNIGLSATGVYEWAKHAKGG